MNSIAWGSEAVSIKQRCRLFISNHAPYFFLAPAIILLLMYLVYPLLDSFHLSLLEWNGLGSDSKFVGLQNWITLLHDSLFWQSLKNNLLLALFSIVFQIPIGLGLALLLDKAGKGSQLLKILYFLPMLFSSVALGLIFKNIYDPNFGPINAIFNSLGLDFLAQDWLGDPHYSLFSVIGVICWQNIPFYMILFMAGLASFPQELTEAATLDGAKPSTIFWQIKLPYLKGTIRTSVLLVIIGSLRYFDLIYVMTSGGPEGSSELMSTYMYRTVFSSFELGYGSTIASAMFLIVTLIAAIGLRITSKYQTEV